MPKNGTGASNNAQNGQKSNKNWLTTNTNTPNACIWDETKLNDDENFVRDKVRERNLKEIVHTIEPGIGQGLWYYNRKYNKNWYREERRREKVFASYISIILKRDWIQGINSYL